MCIKKEKIKISIDMLQKQVYTNNIVNENDYQC